MDLNVKFNDMEREKVGKYIRYIQKELNKPKKTERYRDYLRVYLDLARKAESACMRMTNAEYLFDISEKMLCSLSREEIDGGATDSISFVRNRRNADFETALREYERSMEILREYSTQHEEEQQLEFESIAQQNEKF